MSIFVIIVAVVAVAILAVLGLALAQSDSFTVSRSALISAPPEKIFPFINDFHRWGVWSPWEDIDPTMTRTYDGPSSGVGAIYAWSGTGQVGSGLMEILEAPAPAKVVIKLDFIKPFEAHNTAIFDLEPQGADTRVTWTMEGPRPFISKLMGLVFSMDKMVGGSFEKGLGRLKAAAEA